MKHTWMLILAAAAAVSLAAAPARDRPVKTPPATDAAPVKAPATTAGAPAKAPPAEAEAESVKLEKAVPVSPLGKKGNTAFYWLALSLDTLSKTCYI